VLCRRNRGDGHDGVLRERVAHRLTPADVALVVVPGLRRCHGVKPPAFLRREPAPVLDRGVRQDRVGILDRPRQQHQLLAEQPRHRGVAGLEPGRSEPHLAQPAVQLLLERIDDLEPLSAVEHAPEVGGLHQRPDVILLEHFVDHHLGRCRPRHSDDEMMRLLRRRVAEARHLRLGRGGFEGVAEAPALGCRATCTLTQLTNADLLLDLVGVERLLQLPGRLLQRAAAVEEDV
jgi:hypothetical protein